jgi:ribosomal protein S18 acetylase RimI-like enzyme
MIRNVIIRPCKLKDEEAYVRMNLDFMLSVIEAHPYWDSLKIPTEDEMKQVFREAIAAPEQIMITIAEHEGKMIAYSNTWTVYSIWSMGKAMTIDDIYVLPNYRRNGVSKKIMDYLVSYAQENNYKRIQLHAEIDNEKAHNLYRHLGFIEEDMIFFMKLV